MKNKILRTHREKWENEYKIYNIIEKIQRLSEYETITVVWIFLKDAIDRPKSHYKSKKILK